MNATSDGAACQLLRLENNKAKEVVGFPRMPPILGSFDPDQKQPIHELIGR